MTGVEVITNHAKMPVTQSSTIQIFKLKLLSVFTTINSNSLPTDRQQYCLIISKRTFEKYLVVIEIFTKVMLVAILKLKLNKLNMMKIVQIFKNSPMRAEVV